MAQRPDWYVVCDFEATCDDGFKPRRYSGDGSGRDRRVAADQEVIELPSVVVDARTGRLMTPAGDGDAVAPGEFRQYVRPRVWRQLTRYCTDLTGICQDQVDAARPFAEVLAAYEAWLRASVPGTFLVVCCGDWDMRAMLPRQCYASGVDRPAWSDAWVNAKRVFEDAGYGRASGMMQMLRALRIPHRGRHHSGLDDCRNIAAVLSRIITDGRWAGGATTGSGCSVARSPVDPAERARRRLRKTLAEIDQLVARRDAGEPLERNQLAKIGRADEVRRQLEQR